MTEHIRSYYAATQNTTNQYPALKGTHDTEVCVIGAGFTGVSAALHLVEQGFKVILLEAKRVGWGASGRNGGQWAGFFDTDMSTLEKMLGIEDAKKLWAMNEASKSLLKKRIDKYDIDCDYKQTGLFMGAYNKSHIKQMEEKMLEAERYGYDQLQMIEKKDLPDYIDGPHFIGGQYDRYAGHVHPLNLVCGQAKAAHEAGVEIYEESEVINVKHGHRPQVETCHGKVNSSYLIVCGNGYLAATKTVPKITRKILPVNSYILATEPLPEDIHKKLLPKDCSVFDFRKLLDYYRLSADKRLLFGGGSRYSGTDPTNIISWRLPELVKTFPQLKSFTIDYAWGGTMGFTYNRLPDIGRISKNSFYAQGYSGHGVALAHLGGQLVAEAVTGTAERFDVFDRIKHLPFPGGKMFQVPMLYFGTMYYSLLDALRR